MRCWPTESMREKIFCARQSFVGDMLDQVVGRLPGFRIGLATMTYTDVRRERSRDQCGSLEAADDLIKHVTDETIASARKSSRAWIRFGQQRMMQLHGGRREQLEISPNLWAGVGLVRGGAGTALVGDPANRRGADQEYQEVGIDTFIMSGYPHLEEAYRSPSWCFRCCRWPSRASGAAPGQYRPFGETIATSSVRGVASQS